MEQAYKYMVVTRCFTFNHASYIVDAMNGFTMQETTFPLITLIVDDASTDGEPEVIKEYLADHFQTPYRTEETEDYHLICTNHNTNPNCTFVVFLLKYNHYSIKKSKFPYLTEWLDNAKYHALCEGDDYWIHPKKLQMQVEFLEEHNEYGLVYSNKINLSNSHYEYKHCSGICEFSHLLVKSEIPTLTTCFKQSFYIDYLNEIKPFKHNWLMGDAPLWIYISSKSKIKYMDEWFGVYRVLSESASHSKNIQKTIRFLDSRFEMRYYMVEHFVKDEKLKNKLVRSLRKDKFASRVYLYLKHWNVFGAISYGFKHFSDYFEC